MISAVIKCYFYDKWNETIYYHQTSSFETFYLQVRLYHVLYVVFIQDWFKLFPRNQFHLIKNEDYANDIEGHIKKVFQFLDLGKSEAKLYFPKITEVNPKFAED